MTRDATRCCSLSDFPETPPNGSNFYGNMEKDTGVSYGATNLGDHERLTLSSEVKSDSKITSYYDPYTIVDIAHFDNNSHKVAYPYCKRGRLSVAISPGKKDHRWNRDIDLDINMIKSNGVNIIVCLLEWAEMKKLCITEYPRKAQEAGFIFFHLPIRDGTAPKQNQLDTFIPLLVKNLMLGKNILVHCRGGLGRAGTICACCLTHFGFDPHQAITLVRQRRPKSIQNLQQEDCVKEYCQSR